MFAQFISEKGTAVENGCRQFVAAIAELERKERTLFKEKAQEDAVTLPEGERVHDLAACLPGENALVVRL